MSKILLIAGAVFLFLGFILLIAALVSFLKSRKTSQVAPRPAAPARPAAPPPPPQPAAQPRPVEAAPPAPEPRPSPPPPPPPPPPAPEPPGSTTDEISLQKTMMVDMGEVENWGALHCTAGALEGRTFTIDPKGFTIGREGSFSQLVIADQRISKKHVWVGVKDGEVTAIDQGSSNGTYLNSLGNRITEVKLAPGDVLILADQAAKFEYRK